MKTLAMGDIFNTTYILHILYIIQGGGAIHPSHSTPLIPVRREYYKKKNFKCRRAHCIVTTPWKNAENVWKTRRRKTEQKKKKKNVRFISSSRRPHIILSRGYTSVCTGRVRSRPVFRDSINGRRQSKTTLSDMTKNGANVCRGHHSERTAIN